MNSEPRQLDAGIYMLEVPFPEGLVPPDAMGGKTLSYLVADDGGWLMVDCGFNHETCFEAVCFQLSALGASITDIRRLVITHCHPDHFGLAGRIKAESGAEIIMHQQDWEMARFVMESGDNWSMDQVLEWARSLGVPPQEVEGYEDIMAFGKMLFPSGLQPDRLVKGKDEPISDGSHLRGILTPGHTPGHLCLYDESSRVLFSGDHVLTGITTHISPSFLTDDNQLAQYLTSLQAVRQLQVDLVLPAHEEPFTDLPYRVDQLLAHHEQRLGQVLAALGNRASSPWEIASHVEWTVGTWDEMDATNRMLAMQETLAHIQVLEERGMVSSVEEVARLYRRRIEQ